MAGALVNININDHVWVKLTADGLETLRKMHRAEGLPGDWKPPQTNDWGWTRFQLWILIQTFGPTIEMTGPSPFDHIMRFEVD